MEANPILQAALAYASQGLAVFPVRPDAKRSFKCAAHSDGRAWGMTREPAEITADFTRWPNARIGIPTGAVNGIVVIETDTKAGGHAHDGEPSLKALEAKHGRLPETRQGISPTGSIHRLFKHPGAGIKIKSTASEIGTGIDVRGDGGMVIAPPSINTDGRQYRFLNSLALAPMPAWLVELTREKPPTISQRAVAAILRPPFPLPASESVGRQKGCSGSPTERPTLAPIETSNAYGAAALEYEITALANTAPGSRNHALNRASFSLHQLVAGGELDGAEVERHLYQAAATNGLIADDGLPSVLATIESGRRAGLQHPRSRGPA
jgi:hypothetical protein